MPGMQEEPQAVAAGISCEPKYEELCDTCKDRFEQEPDADSGLQIACVPGAGAGCA